MDPDKKLARKIKRRGRPLGSRQDGVYLNSPLTQLPGETDNQFEQRMVEFGGEKMLVQDLTPSIYKTFTPAEQALRKYWTGMKFSRAHRGVTRSRIGHTEEPVLDSTPIKHEPKSGIVASSHLRELAADRLRQEPFKSAYNNDTFYSELSLFDREKFILHEYPENGHFIIARQLTGAEYDMLTPKEKRARRSFLHQVNQLENLKKQILGMTTEESSDTASAASPYVDDIDYTNPTAGPKVEPVSSETLPRPGITAGFLSSAFLPKPVVTPPDDPDDWKITYEEKKEMRKLDFSKKGYKPDDYDFDPDRFQLDKYIK